MEHDALFACQGTWLANNTKQHQTTPSATHDKAGVYLGYGMQWLPMWVELLDIGYEYTWCALFMTRKTTPCACIVVFANESTIGSQWMCFVGNGCQCQQQSCDNMHKINE